ncbi:ALDH-like protein [Pochonia chlamydosporia 170]|uniref:aldehyde dehydrogenase (NAD(+)) n=1 Tax=Pochonia chlamydosporia 170 TaxID=1380566 RepID=A0A179F0C0_METCM|nr:ALDH-like protein [Pochonia chlamydosporia 170]OAQ58710.1 ALDH-like protein [Pochonia chlamydosporia 170]
MAIGHIETRLHINGEWVSGKNGKTFPTVNPATEEKIVDVHEADSQDVDLAVAAAQQAFPAWRDLSVFERAEKCLKLAELIDRDRNEIARLEASNMGIPVSAYLPCISGAIDGIKHATGLAHDIHGETSLNTPGFVTFTLRQPFGVCAAIIPWNVPIIMWCGKVIPCVVTGNTIVLKSSEKAPLTSLKLAALASEAGFPPGVINVLSGFGHSAGHALSSHMNVRKISFTGSTRAAKMVMEAAAKSNMKRVCVETGGKNPAIIFDDADLDKAAESVAASIQFNSGQICVSNSRIYVQKGVFSQFVDLFKPKFIDVAAGDPCVESTNFGPQVDKAQFDNILKLIDEAKTDGASLVSGGRRAKDKGFYIQPTIFVQVPKSANIMKTEVFGPVVAIQQFDTEEEVIEESNDTNYGLHGTVFTRDVSRAFRLVKAFEAGMITVNCSSEAGPYDMPFGGWKESGTGRENGRMGLESYYEVKSVTLKL